MIHLRSNPLMTILKVKTIPAFTLRKEVLYESISNSKDWLFLILVTLMVHIFARTNFRAFAQKKSKMREN